MRNSVVTTEMCSKYHPDKACDQVSDAILTECLRLDPTSKVACETLWKGETVVLAGEITTSAEIDYEKIVREVADSLNYKVSEIKNLITTQSSEIHNAVVKENNEVGAGDQGIMWGYACNDISTDYLPIGLWTANEVGTNDSGKKELLSLFNGTSTFETPKPVSLLNRILTIASKDNNFRGIINMCGSI